MHYRLLGPLQVVHGESQVDVGSPKQRAVLAALLIARGRVVSTDRLIDAVWGDDVPGSATAGLQAYISNLRKALRPIGGAVSPIVRQPPGYALEAASTDLAEFEDRCAAARAAVAEGSWRQALTAVDDALALWRGPLLSDLRDEPWVREEAGRVDDLRTECVEHRVTALLALGRVPEAVAEAAELRSLEPLRDRGAWLQMLALYRAGRTAEALDVFASHTRTLDDELGLDPGSEVRDLQVAILRQAPELAAWPRSPEWTGAAEVPAPAATQTSAPEPAPTGLVGRHRELFSAARLLDDVMAGGTRWLVLTGPPGIGKTRLAEEVADRAAHRGAQVIWVGCPDERGTPAWWPMRQLVRGLGAETGQVLHVPPDVDSDTARFHVYERVQTLLEHCSRAQPVALVIDNVQWADPTSASCLAYLAGALRDHRILVVITVRDIEHGPELARLLATAARGDGNRQWEVPALDGAEVAVLANQVAEDELSDAEAAALAERTGGNPFFVSEYARLPRAERTGAVLPGAIRSVLDRRLAVLDPAVLQVLRAAAVIGDTVEFSVLAATTGLDVDTLADHLDDAADERIVVGAHDGEGYAFAHGLLRTQLLADIPALRRQRLHARVAEVLDGAAGDAALTRRAQHLVAALPLVEPVEVVDACRCAAESATQRWSSETAARWWQAALDAYDLMPAALRSDDERDGLTVALLDALARAGRGQTVLETVQRHILEALHTGRTATAGRLAGALLRVSGGWPWLAPGVDPGPLLTVLDRAAELATADPAAEARIRAALAVGHCYHPDTTVAADHLARSMTLAQATHDADVIADALMGHLITYSGVAEFSGPTVQWVDELLALGHNGLREDAVIAHSVATMAAMNLGDVDGAQAHLRAGIEGSEALQLPVLRAQLRWTEALIALWRGDFAETARHHDIAASVHEQTELYEAGSGMLAAASLIRETGRVPETGLLAGDVPAAGGEGMVGVVRVALAAVRGDDPAAAEMLVRRGVDGAEAHDWMSLGYHVLLAQLCADHGLAGFARELLARLDPFRDRIAVIGQVGLAGTVAHATARLRVLLGESAEADLATAEAISQRTDGVPSLVRCRLLRLELGDGDAAALERDARRLGMHGVADAAARLGPGRV
ncbi:BTAD domain-containing putative transcriptional regulator [Mycolicibacterium tokaiense]|uniref:SARP family transcriptional regulator n=1 Tax=Mycolicibacterium tokaiense TaxID=39695 RepID=A0A378TCT4_9MYCO|nr:BTAD domain-containing putative transcriptional regulator [Mycolicibacterium tokaiense]BBY87838.1 ATPase AAA [Mycolicibacterium tokaiense]STZ57643.1 SARP family transcriptional regulator [Mycolicibacterium tokaiense]